MKALQRPGEPLLLPTVWDVATARAVVGEGYPVVATTSWGVAGTLGYADDEAAPADEMLAAAARICRGVDVPVTVDTEAGYGLEPTTLVAALFAMGAAGCNLEDTNHRDESLRDQAGHADWLRSIRQAASAHDYRLVVNARIDTFLVPYIEGAQPGSQLALVPDAIERARTHISLLAPTVSTRSRSGSPKPSSDSWPRWEARSTFRTSLIASPCRTLVYWCCKGELGDLPVRGSNGAIPRATHYASKAKDSPAPSTVPESR